MTVIKFHGILKKIYGAELKLNLGNLNNVVIAIDSIKRNFRKTLNDLLLKGKNYSIEIDYKNKIINFVPALIGSGKVWNYIIGAVLIVVGVVLLFIPGAQMFGIMLITSGLNLIIQTALMKGPKPPPPTKSIVGGTAGRAGAENKQYFNRLNSAFQGKPIPIGYGKLKVFNNLLNYSIKSFPQYSSFNDALLTDSISTIDIYND